MSGKHKIVFDVVGVLIGWDLRRVYQEMFIRTKMSTNGFLRTYVPLNRIENKMTAGPLKKQPQNYFPNFRHSTNRSRPVMVAEKRW